MNEIDTIHGDASLAGRTPASRILFILYILSLFKCTEELTTGLTG
jgi:hypothetical protein